MIQGKNIRIFLADGSINGVVHAEIINWTGQIVVFPRGKLVELNKQEYEKSGIYFLFNEDERKVYIGETDNVSRRLPEHVRKKEFWDRVCIITSKDFNLTKSHIRYLENKLIALVQNNENYTLDNQNNGSRAIENLSRPDMADMEYFLKNVELIFSTLGLDFLKTGKISKDDFIHDFSISSDEKNVTDFVLSTKGLQAFAQDVDGRFIVLKGSQISPYISESSQKDNTYILNLRPNLLAKGIVNPETFTFMESYIFNSPSAAAAVISGRGANGRTMWKLKSNPSKTYADWQNEQEDVQISIQNNDLG